MSDPAIDLDVKRLRLKPGDVLVVRCANLPTVDVTERISGQISALLGAAGHGSTKVMVLGPDMTLEIIGKDGQPG